MWLTPNAPVYFKFVGSRSPAVSESWLLALGNSADSSSGLVVTNETGELARAQGSVRSTI